MSSPRQPDGYRHSVTFAEPERIPWSELGPEFAQIWGRPNGKFQPEHVEITGQTGSGKTYLLVDLLQERARVRGSAEIMVVTKKADDTVKMLGWPIVSRWQDVPKYRQVIFWPRTEKIGKARRKFHEQRIYDLLAWLWQEDANIVVAFDEIGYVEGLPGPKDDAARMKEIIQMYWREARSNGITAIGMKQRPIGVVRDQHSETRWKFVFPPADRGDLDRFAELLGAPRDWAPILDGLDQTEHEFIVRNSVTKMTYISWIDYELRAIPSQTEQGQPKPTPRETLWGRRNRPT